MSLARIVLDVFLEVPFWFRFVLQRGTLISSCYCKGPESIYSETVIAFEVVLLNGLALRTLFAIEVVFNFGED